MASHGPETALSGRVGGRARCSYRSHRRLRPRFAPLAANNERVLRVVSVMDQESLKIERPCPKSWAELSGMGSRRFCSQCQHHVVNGSELTKEGALQLVKGSKGGVCLRIEIDSKGNQIFAPTAFDRKRRTALISGLLSTLLAACGPERKPPEQSEAPPAPKEVVTFPDDAQGTVDEQQLIRRMELMGYVCSDD